MRGGPTVPSATAIWLKPPSCVTAGSPRSRRSSTPRCPRRRPAKRDAQEQVSPDDIADVVSSWTGIPAGRLLEGETAKLLRMEDELGKRVVGQKKAVAAVSDAVRRTRAGVADLTARPVRSCSSVQPVWQDRTREGAG